ncbi:DUF7940 domain-containing protein [Acinetobacter baumannii]
MKLINNWQQAHKALSVILPTITSVIMLLIYCIQQATDLSLIPDEYIPFVTTVLVPVMSWIGRVIPQVSLMFGKIEVEEDE